MLLNRFLENKLNSLIANKLGDFKIGETIELLTTEGQLDSDLADSFVQFALLGITEDVGAKSIGIVTDTADVFDNMVAQFVNFQDNLYLHGANILLMGNVKTADIAQRMKILSVTDEQIARAVEIVDERVYNVAKTVFDSGKVPIFIGGGQNNSYPILRALSESKGSAVNCLNISAHTSLQPPENRHARNAFSFALVDGYLDKYFIFGIHESEVQHDIFEFIMANNAQIAFTRYEEILKNDPYMFAGIQRANDFVANKPFGLEINLNSVSDLLLSPDYPDGFLLREIRQLIRKVCVHRPPEYIHICEARAGEKGSVEEKIVGKSLALLVVDFIKSYNNLDD